MCLWGAEVLNWAAMYYCMVIVLIVAVLFSVVAGFHYASKSLHMK